LISMIIPDNSAFFIAIQAVDFGGDARY